MQIISIQGIGIGTSTGNREDDLRIAVSRALQDATLKAIVSVEIRRGLEILYGPRTPEFRERFPFILEGSDEYISDISSTQDSYMPSGNLKAIYTYIMDLDPLRRMLIEEGILGMRTPEEPVGPPEAPPGGGAGAGGAAGAAGAAGGVRPPSKEILRRMKDEIIRERVGSMLPSTPTHVASMNKTFLRSRPSIKGRVIKTLTSVRDRPLKFRIINEYIGTGCEWHEVRFADDDYPALVAEYGRDRASPVYVHRTQLVRIEEITSPSLDISCACKKDKNYTAPSWRNMSLVEPFLDKSRCEYSVVVETGATNTDDLDNLKITALSAGVLELLNFYDKHQVIDAQGQNLTLKRILDAFKSAYIEPGACGWHLDPRPNSRLKILVRFPAKYFDAFSRKVDDLSTVAALEEVPEVVSEEDPVIAQEGFRTTNFVIKRLKKKIELLGETFANTGAKINNFGGKITVNGLPVNLAKEYESLATVPAAFVKLLSQNGFRVNTSADDTVEVGFNRDFRVEYVLSNKGDSSVPCKIGFFHWREKSPIDNPTTMALLFYLDDLIATVQRPETEGKPWTELVGDFLFPVPDIKLSADMPSLGSLGGGLPELGSFGEFGDFGDIANFTGGGFPDVGSLGSVDMPDIGFGGAGDWNFGGSGSPGGFDFDFDMSLPKGLSGMQFKFDGVSLKSLDDLNMEDLALNVPDLKLKLADMRLSKLDFIGDNLFANASLLIPKIGSLNDIFSEFLNKVSLPDISKLLASLSAGKMSFPDVMGTISDSAMKLGSFDDLINIKNLLPSISQLKIDSLLTSFDIEGMDFKTAWGSNLTDRLSRLELRRAGNIALKISEFDIGKFPKISDIDFSLDAYSATVGDAAGLIEDTLGEELSTLKDIKLNSELLNLSKGDLSFADVETLFTGGRVLDLRGKLNMDGVDVNLDDIKEFLKVQGVPDAFSNLEKTADDIINRYGSELSKKSEVLREAIGAFTSGADIAEAAKKILPDQFSKIQGVLDGRLDDAKSQLQKVMGKIPTLKLPEDFPIFDSEPTDEEIIGAVKDAVTSALMSLVKDMLQQISQHAMGLLPANPAAAMPPGSVNLGESLEEDTAEAVSKILESEGIDTGILVPPATPSASAELLPATPSASAETDPDTPSAEAEPGADPIVDASTAAGGNIIKDFLSDISSFLRPDEICGLFEGRPTPETATMMKSFVKERYPSLFERFSSTANITSFFGYLGSFLDPGLCRGIRIKLQEIEVPFSGLPCSVGIGAGSGEGGAAGEGGVGGVSSGVGPGGELREELLIGRASPKQIEDLIDKVRDEEKKKLGKLLDMAAGQPLLADSVPPLVSDCEEDSAIEPKDLGVTVRGKAGVLGVLQRSNPSTEAMGDTVISSFVDTIDTAFSKDCTGFLEDIIQPGPTRLIDTYDDEWSLLKVDLGGFTAGGVAHAPHPEDRAPWRGLLGKWTGADAGGIADEQEKNELAKKAGIDQQKLYKQDRVVLPEVQAALASIENIQAKVAYPGGEFRGVVLTAPKAEKNLSEDMEAKIQLYGQTQEKKQERRRIASRYNAAETKRRASGSETSAKSERLRQALDTITGQIEGEERTLETSQFNPSPGTDTPVLLIEPDMENNNDEVVTEGWTLKFNSPRRPQWRSVKVNSRLEDVIINWLADPDKYISTTDSNRRADLFANMIYNSHRNAGAVTLPLAEAVNDRSAEGYFAKIRDELYNDHFVFALSRMMTLVSETSEFFVPGQVASLELNPGKYKHISSDPCNPEPPQSLLRPQDIKDKIKKDYKNSCGALDPNTTGPFQDAMSLGIIDIVIRMGVIEIFLKGLQSLELFNLADIGDPLLVDYISDKIRAGVKYDYEGATFYEDFFDKLKDAYDKEGAHKEPGILDPLTGAPDERLLNVGDPETINGFNALRNRVAGILREVHSAFEDQFAEMDLLPERNQQLLEQWIVGDDIEVMDVPDFREQGRFITTYVDPDQAYYLRELRVKEDKYAERSNFILERYVRVIPKPPVENPTRSESVTEGLLADFFSEVPAINRPLSAEQARRESGDPVVDGVGRPAIVTRWTHPRYGVRDQQRGVVLSISRFEELMDRFMELLNQADIGGEERVSKYITIKSGLRYTHVAPVELRESPGSDAHADWNSEEERLAVADREKAYFLEEMVCSVLSADGARHSVQDNLVKIVTTPIFSSEIIKFDNLTFGGVADLGGGAFLADALEVPPTTDAPQLGGTSAQDHYSNLFRSEELQVLFQYIFPLKTFATTTLLYNAQAAEFGGEVEGAFTATKERIRSAFYSLSSKGDDMTTAEDEKLNALGGQAGMLKSANASRSHRGPAGFPSLMRLAAQTVPVLIKGLAAEMDPHYGLVDKIDKGLELIGAGGFPTGMTVASIPIFWPINFSPIPLFIGWGPPLTPLGMAAYAFGEFDSGEKRRAKKRKQVEKMGTATSKNEKCD